MRQRRELAVIAGCRTTKGDWTPPRFGSKSLAIDQAVVDRESPACGPWWTLRDRLCSLDQRRIDCRQPLGRPRNAFTRAATRLARARFHLRAFVAYRTRFWTRACMANNKS